MSLILNALRRADRERRQDPLATSFTPPPEVAPVAYTPRAEPHWPWILMGIALALSVAGWVLMIFKPAPAAPPQPIVILAPTPAEATPEEDLQSLSQAADEAAYDSLDDLMAPITEDAGVQVAAPVAAVRESETESESATPVETRREPEVSIQLLRDMPEDFRAAFPALQIDVHVYDKQAARRFVRINGQRYLEGDALDSGPQIEAINAVGIVFRFRGERVLFPAGG